MSDKANLSPLALALLNDVFGPESKLNAPIGAMEQILEIRRWVAARLVRGPEKKAE